MPSWPPSSTGSGRRRGYWMVAFAIALSGAALEARRSPAIMTAHGACFDDPDDYMRVYRARRMLETGALRIRFMPEINYPLGAELHWTAPMDWLLVGAMAVFAPLLKQADPFATVATWVPVVGGIAYTLLMIAFIRRLGGSAAGLIAGAMVTLSPAFHRAFQLGHPDHHFLLEFLFLLAVSLWTRTGQRGAGSPTMWACAVSGLAMGLAIWIAPQALAVWLCILAGATLATFHASPEDRPAWSSRRLAWTLGVLAVVSFGWLFENWPEIGRVSADKISLWTVVIIAASLWTPDGTATGPERRRAIRAFSIVLGCAIGWMALDRGRILEFVSRPEFARWSALVMELQPLAGDAGGVWSARGMYESLGYSPLVLPLLVLGLCASKSLTCQLKVTLSLLAIGSVGASLLQRRWLDHVNVGLVPVAVLGGQELCRRLAVRRPLPEAATAGLLLLVLAGMFKPAVARVLATPPNTPNPQVYRACRAGWFIRDAFSLLPEDVEHPPAILSEDGDGPILLYQTRQPIVAAPYHRALDGLLEAASFYAERDPAAARRQLDRLGVGYVVVPYRAHEQLMNMERIAFGELRSFDPPLTTQDSRGNAVQMLQYRPGAARTMAYRLTRGEGRGLPGLRLVFEFPEETVPPDRYAGRVYEVQPLGDQPSAPPEP